MGKKLIYRIVPPLVGLAGLQSTGQTYRPWAQKELWDLESGSYRTATGNSGRASVF
jgi:hypothetical protein